MSKRIKNIVVIGGGIGSSIVLSGLKKYPFNLNSILTMFDSGGSSGKLRDELGVLPCGDIRQCLVALANKSNLTKFLHYRFEKGKLKGHNLGNLLITGVGKMAGSLERAVDIIGKLLNIKGRIIPVTLSNADIVVLLNNKKIIKGEENIINCRYLSKIGIKKIFLKPDVKANPKAISAIKKADFIIIAPGKFYTSILPNFLVKGIKKIFRSSRAKKIFICNLMTQKGNTDNFSVEDFLIILEKYLGEKSVDYVIFNTGRLPKNLLKKIKKVFPKGNFVKYDKSLLKNKKFIGADILDRHLQPLNPSDILVKKENKRTMILHNKDKLAKIIVNLCRR
jgi:uncharacterized cofD-like protein